MSDAPATLCFTCGQPAGDPPVLNSLSDGRRCPTCRDRVLEALPPALPREQAVEPETAEEPELDFAGSLVDADDGDRAG